MPDSVTLTLPEMPKYAQKRPKRSKAARTRNVATVSAPSRPNQAMGDKVSREVAAVHPCGHANARLHPPRS